MGAPIHPIKFNEIGQRLGFPEDLLESLSGEHKGSQRSLQITLPVS